jgi:hypothetical protein
LLIADGVARGVPLWVTIVIGCTPANEPRLPVWPLIVAVAPPNPTEPKLVNAELEQQKAKILGS